MTSPLPWSLGNAVGLDRAELARTGSGDPTSGIYGGTPQEAKLIVPARAGATATAVSVYSEQINLASGWHFHEMHQLTFAFDGAVEVEIAEGIHLLPCQVAAWIPASVPHRMRLRRERSGTVWFPVEMMAEQEMRVRTVLINPLMREMLREAMRWPMFSPPSRLREQFFRAMASLCEEWIQNEADLFIPTTTDPRLGCALNYAKENWDIPLSVVCRHAGMSERSLRRHLKSETGLTWAAYRRRARMLRAISLLDETQQSIAEVAMQCGFEDASWFSKVFRSMMGELPREYRSRTRNK